MKGFRITLTEEQIQQLLSGDRKEIDKAIGVVARQYYAQMYKNKKEVIK